MGSCDTVATRKLADVEEDGADDRDTGAAVVLAALEALASDPLDGAGVAAALVLAALASTLALYSSSTIASKLTLSWAFFLALFWSLVD